MLTIRDNPCSKTDPNLIYDEACLDIYSDKNVTLYAQYIECENCELIEQKPQSSYLFNTIFGTKLQAEFDNGVICNKTLKLDEHARYGWNFTEENCSDIHVEEAADNAYLPILGAIIVFLCFGTLWYMVKCIYKCTCSRRVFLRYFRPSELTNDLGQASDGAPLVVEQAPKRKHPSRIKSIDVFRGFCIILMIFVNYGGGKYWFFKHSVWNGLTVADLVFPWFMWVMGFSITISIRNRLRAAVPRKQIALQIVQRSCLLILIGLVLNSHGRKFQLDNLRFPGVLQRLGIAYLCVGLLEAIFTKRSPAENYFGNFSFMEDIIIAWPQWLIVLSLVALHTCFTFLLPVPNCPAGYLGPGGLHDHSKFENCTGGAAGHLDRAIFGSHMYKYPTCKEIYGTKLHYDPEGLLGTLTAILTVYLGVQAARILYTYTSLSGKVIRWITWTFVTGLIAGLLCNFTKNDGVIPVNKNLWSLSYALCLSSMAIFIECTLYILVDITRKWGGRPFFYPGMNAILLYIGHEVMRNNFPFAWVPYYKNHREYLAMNLWGTFLWVVIAIFLYKKNIFFKL